MLVNVHEKRRQCDGKHHQSIYEKNLNLTKATASLPPTPVEGAKQLENTTSITATASDGDHVITANQTVAARGNIKANKRSVFLQTAEGKQVPVRKCFRKRKTSASKNLNGQRKSAHIYY